MPSSTRTRTRHVVVASLAFQMRPRSSLPCQKCLARECLEDVENRSTRWWPCLGDEGKRIREAVAFMPTQHVHSLWASNFHSTNKIFFSLRHIYLISWAPAAGLRCCSIYLFPSTSCHAKTGSTRDSQQQEKENIFTCYSARKSETRQTLKASTALCCNWCTRRLPGKHLAPRPLNYETPVGTRVAMRCSHAPSQRISPLCRCTSYSWIVMCA
jgi:hypothetical protein